MLDSWSLDSWRDLLSFWNENIIVTSDFGSFSFLVHFADKITDFFSETVLAKYFLTNLFFLINFSTFFSQVEFFLTLSSPCIFIHMQ